MSDYDEELLWASIEGIWAYDEGAVDSGIRDESLRRKCAEQVNAMAVDERRSFFARQMSYYLSDEGIEAGYGIEDVSSFERWLDGGGLR